MRFSLGLLLTLALAAPAAAQGSRFSMEPFYSYASPSAIYDKTTTYPVITGNISQPPTTVTDLGRLPMGAVQPVGAGGGYRLGNAWSMQLEASHGSSRYRYLARTEATTLFSEETWEG